MARQALIEHRPWLLASIVAATAFYFLSDNPVFEGTWGLLAKGASVSLLALYALRRAPRGHRRADGRLLAAALLLSAAGDVAIVLYFEVGGALFAAAHCVAIALYLRNRRARLAPSQRMLGAALLIATPLVSYLLSGQVPVAAYGVFLGAMAAAAWCSRFPRYRVGMGAVLFVVSDWLIFSRLGSFDLGVLPDLLIWPLYYAGVLMIATGVVQTLRADHES